MKRILICTGVLGSGTALVFGAAALVAVMAPSGAIVPGTLQQGVGPAAFGNLNRGGPTMIGNVGPNSVITWQQGLSGPLIPGAAGTGFVIANDTPAVVPAPAVPAPAPTAAS